MAAFAPTELIVSKLKPLKCCNSPSCIKSLGHHEVVRINKMYTQHMLHVVSAHDFSIYPSRLKQYMWQLKIGGFMDPEVQVFDS